MDVEISNDAYHLLKTLYSSPADVSAIPSSIVDYLISYKLVELVVSGCRDLPDLPPTPLYEVRITEYGRGYVDGRIRNERHICNVDIRGWISLAIAGASFVLALISILR